MLGIILAWLPLAALRGQDLWIDSSPEGYLIRAGLPAPGKEQPPLFHPFQPGPMQCASRSGLTVLHNTRNRDHVELSCDTIAVNIFSGYRTRTLLGIQNVSRDMAPWFSFGTSALYDNLKRINHWNPATSGPITHSLEITPLELPRADAPAGTLFLLTLNRAGIANTEIYHNGQPVGTTDQSGKLRIKLRTAGLQIFRSQVTTQSQNSLADSEVITTHLTLLIEP